MDAQEYKHSAHMLPLKVRDKAKLDVIDLMRIGLDQIWQHQMLARLAKSSGAKFLAITCLVAYANTGAPATTRCTAASTSSGWTMVAASNSNAYAVGTSWLLNLTTCITQNMFARPSQQMWTVDTQLTASGKQQKGKYLELVPFKVAGKLLEVNDLSL